MDISQKASFSIGKFQRGFSLIDGLLAQAFYPAGPDGIHGQSTSPSSQVPVWLYQVSLQRACQEHGATANIVCRERFVDGQEADYSRGYRMSASAKGEIARQGNEKASHSNQYAPNFDAIVFCDSLNNCLTIDSHFDGGCADLP